MISCEFSHTIVQDEKFIKHIEVILKEKNESQKIIEASSISVSKKAFNRLLISLQLDEIQSINKGTFLIDTSKYRLIRRS